MNSFLLYFQRQNSLHMALVSLSDRQKRRRVNNEVDQYIKSIEREVAATKED